MKPAFYASSLVCLLCLLFSSAASGQVKGQRPADSLKKGLPINQKDGRKQIPDPMAIVPIPQQIPAKEGLAELPGTRLGYWDTGGNGTPIVLLHPASGSALIWLYQQPAFAQAGFRVIAYSRRNAYNSDLAPADNPGIASEDLHNFVEYLGLKKF